MKNKKFLKFGALGTLVVGGAVALVLLAGHANNLVKVRGAVHDGDCNWNHYEAVEARDTFHGSKEFWASCSSPGTFSLTEPLSGTINEMGSFENYLEYFYNLDENDDRYISPTSSIMEQLENSVPSTLYQQLEQQIEEMRNTISSFVSM